MLNATVVPVINMLASMSVIRNPENLMIMTKMIVNTYKYQMSKSYYRILLSYPLCSFENTIKCSEVGDIDIKSHCYMSQLIHKVSYQDSSSKERKYTF